MAIADLPVLDSNGWGREKTGRTTYFKGQGHVEGSMFIIFLLNQGKLNLKQDTHTLAKV